MKKEKKLTPATKASMKWASAHVRQFKFNLNDVNDTDIIAWLDSIENKQGYLKQLIRKDMAQSLPTVQQTIDNIQKYKGYLPLAIYDTTDLSAVQSDLESDGMTAAEAADFISDKTWVKICRDGVVILADIHDAEFEWNGKKYTVQADKWTVE